MFAWVGSQFDAVLSTYVLGVVGSLMAGIAPIALTAMTIWVALYGWAVLRNEVPETVPTFLWKVFKIGLVLAFALQSAFYIANVADTANALATGVATTFLPAAADPTTISSPYALLDSFNDGASQLVLDLLKDAGIMRLDLLFAGQQEELAQFLAKEWRARRIVEGQRSERGEGLEVAGVTAVDRFHPDDRDDHLGRYAVLGLGAGQGRLVLLPELDTLADALVGDKDRPVVFPRFYFFCRPRNGIQDRLLTLHLSKQAAQLLAGKTVTVGHFADKGRHVRGVFIITGHRLRRASHQAQT